MALFSSLRAKRHYVTGTLALQNGDFQSSISHLARAVELRPAWPEAQHNYGNALMAAADFSGQFLGAQQTSESAEAALTAFDEAIRLQQIFPEAHNNRGRALVKLQRLSEADAAFTMAVDQRPDYENALQNREGLRSLVSELQTSLESETDESIRRWATDRIHPAEELE